MGDEANLILCDECDISYHIYCLDPPLDQVPQDTWKCKWCAICQMCGNNNPGVNSTWFNNYSLCGPCHSLGVCLLCEDNYEDAELIMKCSTCHRWYHGECDSIQNEADAEKCAEETYECPFCRPEDALPPHLIVPPPPPPPPAPNPIPPSPPPSPDFAGFSIYPNSNFMVDGYMLSERGMTTLKCQMIEKEKKRRPRNLGKGDPDDMDDDDLMPPPTPAGPHKDGDTIKA